MEFLVSGIRVTMGVAMKEAIMKAAGFAVRAGVRAGVGAGVGVGVGAGVTLVGVPAVVSLLGFKAGGIAAGSIGAKMMSAAAIANGGGVAAGSTVAILQSIGAAGLSLGAKIGVPSALGFLGAAIKWLK